MPVLLLCQGDAEAKNQLKRAIEWRYGVMPPVIDSLELEFTGRAKTKVGPVKTWVPVHSAGRFTFPSKMRWDFNITPLGLPVQKSMEAYDGEFYRSNRRSQNTSAISDPIYVDSVRKRLWAMAALLLTPMSELHVQLKHVSAYRFSAVNLQMGDSVTMNLDERGSLSSVEVNTLNPDTQQNQNLRIVLSPEQSIIDGLILPNQISAYWDSEVWYELKPVRVNLNPSFHTGCFNLKDEAYII